MMDAETGAETDQQNTIHPDLVDCLFVLEWRDGTWIFRNAGQSLSALLGRELGDQDLLDFWTGHDRNMMAALLASVHESRNPAFVHARGETLIGDRVDVEITLAPLVRVKKFARQSRVLGLYQTLSPVQALKGRPVWRHRITDLVAPDFGHEAAQVRLVASND